ncbi:EF-hand domain-containing protein [Saccharothrix syringae]|uniref:EF-hand domain-containing protein n=1 Tax=Saccharothrix syringae TaxID=103733 RepID=A0A5Q0GYK2_SACSY|nr:EF-hand domain-containing protein [Saccharothrix syringae]QFZ18998.1 hypothetical protein EKG83_17445 [Saccharothrix syringae]
MANQLQKGNVDRVFAALDLDGDGRLTWADFEVTARDIGREVDLGEDAPGVRELTAAYRRVWEYVCGAADTDLDDAVSKDEFEQAHLDGELSTEELVSRWVAAAARGFELVDADRDGRIDLDELTRMYRGAGVADAQAVAGTAFAAMDTDGDGWVDKDEWIASVRGLFTATEGTVKGARLLGA